MNDKNALGTTQGASPALRFSELLAALGELEKQFETMRRRWSKDADVKIKWYWEGRRDGITDAIIQVKLLANQKAANDPDQRRVKPR